MTNRLAWASMLMWGAVLGGCGGGGGDGRHAANLPTAALADVQAQAVPNAATGMFESTGPLTATDTSPKAASSATGVTETVTTKPLYVGPGVGIETVTPSVIEGTVYAGASSMPDVLLRGTASGDIGLLNGKTLYVTVVDAPGFFSSATAAAGLVAGQPSVVVLLKSKIMYNPGSFLGALPIWVCLDTTCKTRLRGMPYPMPYRIEVLRPYRLANGEIPVGAVPLPIGSRFGDVPPQGQMVVIPPERAPFSTLSVSVWGPSFESSNNPTALLLDQGDGTVVLKVTMPPGRTPGTYNSSISLNSSHSVGINSRPPDINIALTHIVSEDPSQPIVFTPDRLNLTAPAGSSTRTSTSFQVKSGKTYGQVLGESLEYLLTPEQEALLPQDDRPWLLRYVGSASTQGTLQDSVDASGCVAWSTNDGGTRLSCLPVGTYAFRIRYRHDHDGRSDTVYYPGQLTITP